MKRLISFVILLAAYITCKAVELTNIDISSIKLSVKTVTEQIHWLYTSTEFVTKDDDRETCDASTMNIDREFTISEGFLYIDKGTEYEDVYQIVSCTLSKGNVLADAGSSEAYRFVVKQITKGEQERFHTFITIDKVEDNGLTKTIVTVPKIDNYGLLYCVITYTK